MSNDPFDWHVDQEYADPQFDVGDPFAAQADEDEAAAHSGPDFVQVEEEEAKPKTPAELVKAMTAEDFARFLQLYVLQKIVNNAVADFTGARKDAMDEVLPLAAKKFSTDQWKVRVPTLDGSDAHIATISVKRTKEKVEVTSETDLLAWLDKNHPDAVYEETIPEKVIPAKVVRKPKAGALPDIVDKADVTADGTLVTADGEPIPGLKVIPADQYNGHMTSFGGKDNPLEMRGRELLLNNRIAGHNIADVITQAAIEKGKQ